MGARLSVVTPRMFRPGVVLGVLLLASVVPAAEDDPVPLAGRAFAPGPRRLGLMGLHVEPATITNFDGVVAVAYLTGTATDGAGNRYRMANDMRVMQGTYVAADGVRRTGTFAFV
jgi:hypothetical protein